jgi:MoaA/NifB/PqqE/SkfB family radical SAM enzyme
MFTCDNIDEYQIEITTLCNAACPQCPRNINGDEVNPHLPLVHLSKDIVDQAFPTELVQQLRQIFFCGSYGDPIAHPDFLEILRDFRRKSPTVWLYLHTNGGIRGKSWWAELAKIINGYGKIDFGIDGLSDTNHLYRKNVNFNKVIENAAAFIVAGGRAQWSFIVFKHNEHQVDEAEALSKELGFETFLPRNTGRFFNHNTIEEMNRWPVHMRHSPNYYLEPPTNPRYKNKSMVRITKIKQEYPDIRDYFDRTEIHCDALLGKKVVITAEGLVLPCNFFTHNLYDKRFYDVDTLPGRNQLSFVNGKNQIRSLIEKHGFENLNIHHRSLKQIFDSEFWQEIIDSWDKDLSHGRIFECAMTCGNKLTKVWDQGGNKR